MKEFRKEELVGGKYYSWVSDYNTDGGVFQFKSLNPMTNKIEYYLMVFGSTVRGIGSITNSNWDRFRELTKVEMDYYTLVFAYKKLVPENSSSKEFKDAYINFTYTENCLLDGSELLDEVNTGDVLFNGIKVFCSINNAWAKVVTEEPIGSESEEEIITIPPILMRDGYAAMSLVQKVLFKENVDAFTGETTKSFIIKYFKEECCGCWVREMEKAFPFLITKEVDLSKIDSDGMRDLTNDLLNIRNYGEYSNLGFYLNSTYNWEIKVDSKNANVLVPTKK
jgi:hypothetical protein